MQLETFRRIIYLDLRPSVLEKFPLAKFKNLLIELEDIQYMHQPLLEVEKEKTFNVRHEYYQRLIDHAAISFLNEFRNELFQAQTEKEKQYIIELALKNLTYYLLENYIWCATSPNNLTESLVKPALKHELVRLYVEVSNEQIGNFGDGFIDEVYQRFYNESAPTPPMIHEASFVVAVLDPKLSFVHTDNNFHIHFADFRPDKKGILSYETIIKNQKRFAEFEEYLYIYGFIDEDYNFTNKHGLKTELAQKYHDMIKEGCFMPRDFKLLKDIKTRDIRKFLDHRYGVDLDKQFRNVILPL
jgi:hypothetical protein